MTDAAVTPLRVYVLQEGDEDDLDRWAVLAGSLERALDLTADGSLDVRLLEVHEPGPELGELVARGYEGRFYSVEGEICDEAALHAWVARRRGAG